ncbi:MAG: ribonuclease G [Proteobacteria bacterium]|nr:ribonuclease G [Pseudomonadota bacterium]MDA1331474.1 ribonuclease G [Pseudomonadota bacterium]
MNHEILLNVTPQETRVAIIQRGIVQELHIEREAQRGLVGNIYNGVVKRILPGMQSAFIDIGIEKAAFLHVADIFGRNQEDANETPIEKILHEGQKILVQVVKDPIGTKGARLSTQVSIAGRLLVYLPLENHIGISQKIGGEEEREQLKERLIHLKGDGCRQGFIVRTLAETASDDEFQSDIDYLRRVWEDLETRAETSEAPSIVYQELALSVRILRDFLAEESERILVDSRETFQKMQTFAKTFIPKFSNRVQVYTSDRPLFERYGVEDEIEKALSKHVNLKSGGYLIIDQTEALTTVDVNTGGFVGDRNFEETIFKNNLEASQAIARQLRLRNLGGIVLIDFIDMKNEAHKQSILEELEKSITLDRTRVTINGFTQLGLVEMTRKRTRESLAHVLCEPCPTCSGRGEIKTIATIGYQILREVVRESRQYNPKSLRIIASQKVVNFFQEEESQSIAMAEEFIGKTILLQTESMYGQQEYDIVLG